jgi:hypothetical protein
MILAMPSTGNEKYTKEGQQTTADEFGGLFCSCALKISIENSASDDYR